MSDAPFELRIDAPDTALQALSGEVVLVTGGAGSGKTRLLQRLAGLAPMPGGTRARLADEPWPRAEHRRVRMRFDRRPPLWMAGSIAEELRFGCAGHADESRLHELLAAWRLPDLPLDADPVELDRLRALRLTLAGMELARPLLALLDAPLSGLSPAEIKPLLDDLREWARRAPCIVVAACARQEDWVTHADRMWHIRAHSAWPEVYRP